MYKVLAVIAILMTSLTNISFSQDKKQHNMSTFSVREQIIETTNRLFNFTDARNWTALQKEVFAPVIEVDMVSLGMPEVKKMTAAELCAMWENGFAGLDAIFHLAGNHAVTLRDNDADVFCYSSATHYKKSATQGNTRTFNGSYELHLVKNENGWRIDKFKYNLLYMEGNAELK
jgi:hypothetical protein